MMELDKLYLRAEDAYRKKNFDYARDLFTQIVSMDPDHAEARKALYVTLAAKFKDSGSSSSFKLGLFSAKTLSHIQLSKSKPDKVIEIAQKHLWDDPNNVKVRLALAEALKTAGHLEGAMAELLIASDIQKDNPKVFKLLGIAYKEKGMIPEAEQALQKTLELDPQDREAGKILRDLAAIATLNKGVEDAQSYRDILKDKDQAAQLERRQHLVQSEDELQGAVDALRSQHEKNPQDVTICKKIADFYFDQKKDYEAAREWYRKASQINPIDVALKNRADDCVIRQFALQIQQLDQAKDPRAREVRTNKLRFETQSYERRVSEQPTDMPLRFELGKLYYADHKVDRAIGEFQQSVKDPKKKADSHLYLGMSFWAKKMYDLAIGQFEKAQECGVMTSEKSLFLKYNMALCYDESGNLEKALEIGKTIMEVDINYKDIAKKISEWMKKADKS